ncbi:MAG: iron ABC transporter permease [Flavobacteriaceae bacterium]|nr:iron ABC transporter permease [Flavobacteriaceae bacterium]
MVFRPSYRLSFVALSVALLVMVLVNISLGSVTIPFTETLRAFIGRPVSNPSWELIIWEYRLPKALASILVGGGLAVSGLLMQTFFRNPLAGPFVLGISSGASLGAAILILGAGAVFGASTVGWAGDVPLVLAASMGSVLVLFVVLVVANRVRDTMALLIIGLMFGSITSAVVSVLAYFSSAEALQRYVFWSFGSVGDLSWSQIGLLAALVLIGLFLTLVSTKTLNALLLGERYAQSLGVALKRSKYTIIAATGILAGSITAFAGPIAFVGLAVPHLARQLFDTTRHQVLLPAVFLYGALLLLVCDSIAQWPNSAAVLPINAITSIVGAPVVIWLLVKKRRFLF